MGSRGVYPGLSRQIQETLVSPLECGVHPKLIYSYASKEKGAVEHDIDVERDWKQFIKDLDPGKKTAQACFTSLVYVGPVPTVHTFKADIQASRAPICPRHHVHRAGPSVQVPRAFRHYDTSNARTTRRTRPAAMTRRGGAPGILLDHEGAAESAINAMAQIDAGVPERQLTHFQNWHNPALENTISRDEQEGHDAQTQAALERRRRIPGLFDDPTSQDAEEAFLTQMQRNAQDRVRAMRGLPEPSRTGNEWTVERRLPSPPAVYHPGDLTRGLLNPHMATGSSMYDLGDDTPISLSGARRPRTLRRFSLPTSSTPDDDDERPIDAFEPLDTTYPLFAALDDAGPYPIEDMFDNDHNHEDEDDDSVDETLYPIPGPDSLGMQERGYEPWWPSRPLRGALPDTDREQTNIIDTADSPYEVVGSPDYTLGPASPTTTGLEYTTRARAEVDEQLAFDLNPGRRLLGVFPPGHIPPAWDTFDPGPPPMPIIRRRQRGDDDGHEEQGEAGGDDERRPVRRLRMDEESGPGPSEGIQQRVRRSIPVESLLSGNGSGSGERDNRRNGLVFDAESYINPNL
jgi:hypothetical protein